MDDVASTAGLPQEDAVRYEVAREILGQLVGYASRRMDQEEDQATVDQAAVELWQRRRDDWAARWRNLRAHDTAAVSAVLEEDAATLRSLSAT